MHGRHLISELTNFRSVPETVVSKNFKEAIFLISEWNEQFNIIQWGFVYLIKTPSPMLVLLVSSNTTIETVSREFYEFCHPLLLAIIKDRDSSNESSLAWKLYWPMGPFVGLSLNRVFSMFLVLWLALKRKGLE